MPCLHDSFHSGNTIADLSRPKVSVSSDPLAIVLKSRQYSTVRAVLSRYKHRVFHDTFARSQFLSFHWMGEVSFLQRSGTASMTRFKVTHGSDRSVTLNRDTLIFPIDTPHNANINPNIVVSSSPLRPANFRIDVRRRQTHAHTL